MHVHFINLSTICYIFGILKNFYFIHMCIQCTYEYVPPPSLHPLTPHYPAETILPLSLILLKREYKQ
jgi:hypothetical protein